MTLTIKSKLYVNQLPLSEQTVILSTIKKTLITDGIYSNEEITESLDNALHSKYSDVAHLL